MLEEFKHFLELTHKFREVHREIYYPDSERKENDSEHSYQLALSTWYIISSRKMPLDINLAIKYSLVHDLVESYSGDVFFYKTKKEDAEKKKREAEAQEKLAKEYEEFRDLHHVIQQYEKLATKEAQFVYALDKLLPLINTEMDGGRMWKEKEIELKKLIEQKDPKVKIAEEVYGYFKLLLTDLKNNEVQLFQKK